MAPAFLPPEPLASGHSVVGFSSGRPALDEWLVRRAMQNQETGASRTFVVSDSSQVIAFYSLAVGSVEHQAATSKIRRNMPDPIPVMLLARLAVDQRFQGMGLGPALLRDAVIRTSKVAETAGIRAVLVHALDATAAAFYEKFGFRRSLTHDLTLMIGLKEIAATIAEISNSKL